MGPAAVRLRAEDLLDRALQGTEGFANKKQLEPRGRQASALPGEHTVRDLRGVPRNGSTRRTSPCIDRRSIPHWLGPFPRGGYGGAVSRFKPTSPPPANFRDSTDVHPLDGTSVALVREPAGTPRPVLVGRPPLRRCGGAAKFHARCDQRRRLMPNITEANGLRSLNYRRTPKKRTSICGSSRITIPKPPPSPTAH